MEAPPELFPLGDVCAPPEAPPLPRSVWFLLHRPRAKAPGASTAVISQSPSALPWTGLKGLLCAGHCGWHLALPSGTPACVCEPEGTRAPLCVLPSSAGPGLVLQGRGKGCPRTPESLGPLGVPSHPHSRSPGAGPSAPHFPPLRAEVLSSSPVLWEPPRCRGASSTSDSTPRPSASAGPPCPPAPPCPRISAGGAASPCLAHSVHAGLGGGRGWGGGRLLDKQC